MLLTLSLWLVSTPRDRAALRIVLIAALASEVVKYGITHQIHASWNLIFPTAVEILTIEAMLKWSPNRTGYLQAGLLVIAGLTHVLCYADILMRTNLVYSRYETILAWVSAGQLVTCYDTMRFNLNRAYNAATACWADCVLGVPDPSNGAAVSRVQVDKGLQALQKGS